MRRINYLLILFVVLHFNISCSKNTSTPPETLVVALSSQPNSIDPRYATDATGMRISKLLFSSLVQIGPELEVVGDAARNWSYKNNVFQFDVIPNLKFSNGRTVNCEDIHYSFEFFKSNKSPFHTALESIDRVSCAKKAEHLLVKLHLKYYSSTLLPSALPVVRFLPKKEILANEEKFKKELIGSGRFRFLNQSANDIELIAKLDHPLGAAKVSKLNFKVIRDDVTRVQKTLKGSIDIAQNEIPPLKISSFAKKKKEFQLHKYPGLSFSYMLLNLKTPFIRDKNFRLALAHAIDRDAIINFKMAGLATKADSFLTPGNPMRNNDLKKLEFNLEKAKGYLMKSTYKGQPLRFKTSNNPSVVDKAKVIARQLQEVGIKVNLESFEWGTYYGDIKAGRYDLATMRWVGAIDPDIYRIALHSKEQPPRGRNRGFYKNPELDQLVTEGFKLANTDKRAEIYSRIQEIVMDDLPIIPLWYDHQVAVVNQRVKGYKPDLSGDYTPFLKVYKK